jgi:DNA-binding GntR family transcriptional regulator
VSTEFAAEQPTLAQAVARDLEEDILAGRLRPRERLIESDLADRFSVSRAPVREALRMLEREGLVSRSPRGLQVSEPSLDEVREAFEVLADLEELYTRRAVPRLTPQDVKRMKALLAEMSAAAADDDVKRYSAANDQFHGVLRDACPNRTLIRLIASVAKKTSRFRRMAMSMPGRLSHSLPEHKKILEAVVAGDAMAAGQRARESAERAYLELLEFLRHALPI